MLFCASEEHVTCHEVQRGRREGKLGPNLLGFSVDTDTVSAHAGFWDIEVPHLWNEGSGRIYFPGKSVRARWDTVCEVLSTVPGTQQQPMPRGTVKTEKWSTFLSNTWLHIHHFLKAPEMLWGPAPVPERKLSHLKVMRKRRVYRPLGGVVHCHHRPQSPQAASVTPTPNPWVYFQTPKGPSASGLWVFPHLIPSTHIPSLCFFTTPSTAWGLRLHLSWEFTSPSLPHHLPTPGTCQDRPPPLPLPLFPSPHKLGNSRQARQAQDAKHHYTQKSSWIFVFYDINLHDENTFPYPQLHNLQDLPKTWAKLVMEIKPKSLT